MEALPYLRESYTKDEERHFIKEYSDMIRTKRFKLEKNIFRVDIGKKFFAVRVVGHWTIPENKQMPHPWKRSEPRGININNFIF